MKKRSYQQQCALARASDMLGERWTLLVFRELLIQPCRYKELNHYLAGMGTNLLAQRLKELETEGFIEKLNPVDKRSEYQLTEAGWSVEPIVLSLIRWGLHWSGEQQEEGRHFDHWDLLAMKALFNAEACAQAINIQFEAEQFSAWCKVDPISGCKIGMGQMNVGEMSVAASTRFEGTVLEFRAYMNNAGRSGPQLWHKFAKCFRNDGPLLG